MQPVIYADFRPLQDQNFQGRGIGFHTAALLRALRASSLGGCRVVGLADAGLSAVPESFRSLADEIVLHTNVKLGAAPAIYFDGSPMTHDTRFGLRFQNHPSVFNAAVLHDFIPYDWPGYLPTPATRIDYMAKLARLKKFDLLLPVSRYTAARATELLNLGPEQFRVTGSCVRRSLYDISAARSEWPDPYAQREPYFVTFGGDDRRKNTDAAVRAVRLLNLIHGRRIPLKVLGFYSGPYRDELLEAAGHEYGKGFVEFYPNTLEEEVHTKEGLWHRPSVPDEEIVSLHAGAIASIAPSHIEGFSLPVVESLVARCPVIASTCAAHMELIQQEEALFRSDDVDELYARLEPLLGNPSLRASLLERQAYLAPKYHESEVGGRAWQAIAERFEKSEKVAPATHGRKCRIAILSAYPPDISEAALYTRGALEAANGTFQASLYTNEEQPADIQAADVFEAKASPEPLLDANLYAVVSVLDGTCAHLRVYRFFHRYGGPCILHDFRLSRLLLAHMGEHRFLELLPKLLGRSVGIGEVHAWLEEREREPLLLKPVIDRAAPLIVNSKVQQRLLRDRYGVEAPVTNCAPTLDFRCGELTPDAKAALRQKYGIAEDCFAIAAFGKVKRSNGRDAALLAIDLLRSWNIPAELYFIGDATDSELEINRIAKLYGVASYIHYGEELATDEAERDFFVAADAGLVLRSYACGRVSVPVANCVSAGLPCTTTIDTAEANETPDFVRTVPDAFSPLHIAEELAPFREDPLTDKDLLDARAAWLETHNFEVYSRRLREILQSA